MSLKTGCLKYFSLFTTDPAEISDIKKGLHRKKIVRTK